MKNDFFAEIAAAGIGGKQNGLAEPQPPELPDIVLELGDAEASFRPGKKIGSREELYEEVDRQKRYYAPFLEDFAPELPELRGRRELTQFQWRIGTAEDAGDLAGVLKGDGEWESVTVPHYGEPRGVAVTYYRTEFELAREELNKGSMWISFGGVDYKAHVFINGNFLGSHEGFFAPFEFEFTSCAQVGRNSLTVMVENDYVQMGSCSQYKGTMYTGDKFYAATGLGYDDPVEGWHHCPPGMGIWQDVCVEARSTVFLRDIFVRPLPKEEKAELWLEVYSTRVGHRRVEIEYSVYGQNFQETVLEGARYVPETFLQVGMGDTLTEAKVKAEGRYHQGIPMLVERGINYFKISFDMKDCRIWEPDTPWLYQCQVKALDEAGICDQEKRQFGMRSFRMEEASKPRGKLYLNGRQVRLRGANTMGHEQQCVFHKNWEQLLTDLILAKVCNMNFLRLTQRPVQPQVYEICDRLGLMIQTDLPLFAALRRNQFTEGLKQVQEMEHLIRSHPCCVIASYINEPMPNAHNKPHRNLERAELEQFFQAADICLRIMNPDRVVKHVDGDYEPPTEGFPDNHCYPCWYNGHGIDAGRLHKGYWMPVKEGWHYGCGEFGIEAMEEVSVMRKYYPREWLPSPEEEADWNPGKILGAQTGGFHYFFYDTQHSLEDWVRASQRHQAQSISLMTQAFRRDSRMNSFAYHLFIDAFPDGWMKTIMDVDRNPKEGFFAYRDALTPLMVNLRCDRLQVFSGEKVPVEAWICNDRDDNMDSAMLHYQVECGEDVWEAGRVKADIPQCSSRFQGFIPFHAPEVAERTQYTIRLGLVDEYGAVLHDHSLMMEVFPEIPAAGNRVCVLGEANPVIADTIRNMGWTEVPLEEVSEGDGILIFDYISYQQHQETVHDKVNRGAAALFQELKAGDYEIAEGSVSIQNCGMLPLHFASRAAGHELVRGLRPEDIRYWYDPYAGYITPLLETTIEAPGWEAAVTSGNQDEQGNWHPAGALMVKRYGLGRIMVNGLKLFGRTGHNPVAKLLLNRMIDMR